MSASNVPMDGAGGEDERWFTLWGPFEGGGESIAIRGPRVFVVAYGNASPLPGGQEVYREVSPTELLQEHGANPRAAPAFELLRERGLLSDPPHP